MPGMKLKAYFKETNADILKFSERVGVHPVTTYRWITGDRIPLPKQMIAIAKETKKKVLPNDFFAKKVVGS